MEAGGDLYGGLIDSCHFVDKTLLFPSSLVFNILTAGASLDISSTPLEVCFCKNDKRNCEYSNTSEYVYPGGLLQVSVSAVGQKNGAVPALIQVDSTSNKISFYTLEKTQKTNRGCTDLQYTILSSESAVGSSELVILFAEGPCPRAGRSLEIMVHILPCPPGFEMSRISCVCAKRLQTFTNTCTVDARTVLHRRNSRFWMGFNDYGGLILHPHCPFDYCRSDEIAVIVDETDMQCNFNSLCMAVRWECQISSRETYSLFVGAMFSLIVLFLPFTMLLFLGQWFLAKSHWKIFSWWVNNPKV